MKYLKFFLIKIKKLLQKYNNFLKKLNFEIIYILWLNILNIYEFTCYEEVKEQMMKESSCRRAAMTILKNINVLSVDELRDACKYLFNTYPNEYFAETNSKRCVLCLDFKENYQN